MLGGILGALAASICALTGILFLTGRIPARRAPPPPALPLTAEQDAAFTGLGILRARTAAEADREAGTMVILRPWFSYSDDGKDFYEELSRKSAAIKEAILSYFLLHTESELHALGEEAIKTELTELINGQLVLGRIDSLYFSEYIFLQ